MSSRFWGLAGMENQTSCSAKAQPGQHDDLYCENSVAVAVATYLFGKDP